MNATIYKIPSLNYEKVSYYTIIIDGNKPEFNDFIDRVGGIQKYRREVGQILTYIKDIGEKHGANSNHFRHERAAEALPPSYHHFIGTENEEYGLRLYCIRLNNSVVILLNGDMKTNRNPELCLNCKKHFRLANELSKKINVAIVNKELWLNDKEIEMIDDFEITL